MAENPIKPNDSQQPAPQKNTEEKKTDFFPFFEPVQIQSDSWLKSAMLWNAIFSERGGIGMKERD